MPAPPVDSRGLDQILRDAQALAALYTPDWRGADLADDPGRDLLGLGSRLVEVLIERLNRVPEKNFLAFLELVGVERAPGMSAEAPVTFVLSRRSEAGVDIPVGTQVATTQSEAADAQIFETRNAFFATPAELLTVLSLIPAADGYAVLPPLPLPPGPEDLADTSRIIPVLDPPAGGLAPIPHELYLASARLFGRETPTDITLQLALLVDDGDLFLGGQVAWERFDDESKDFVPIPGVTVEKLPLQPVTVRFPQLVASAATAVDGDEDRWIRARLATPLPAAPPVPELTAIHGWVAAGQSLTTAPDDGVVNGTPADLSKPVYPFGERPKYGDAFYLASEAAFAPEVGSATLRFTLRPYTDADLQDIFLSITQPTTVTTEIEWQYLATDGSWKPIQPAASFTHTLTVTDGAPPAIARTPSPTERAGTLMVVGTPAVAAIPLTPQADAAIGEVAGLRSRWVRAIIRSPNPYGHDGFARVVGGNLEIVDPTFIAPIVEAIDITYAFPPTAIGVERIKTLNGFRFETRDPAAVDGARPLAPFVPVESAAAPALAGPTASEPGLFLGFDRPFGNVFVSLFAALDEDVTTSHRATAASAPHLVWEYLATGDTWRPLDVEGTASDLTTSGTVGFIAPPDAAGAADLFPTVTGGVPQHWYRARLASGSYPTPPRLNAVLLNTVMADQRTTFGSDWVLASGTGEPGQQAAILRTPVLGGEIWIREPEPPSEIERQALLDELRRQNLEAGVDDEPEPEDVVEERLPDDDGGEREVWVRWLRVPNFLASTSTSRHYTLEAPGGIVTFGDGELGLIPPVARDNIVLRHLQVGGGEHANRVAAPLAIKQLKTALPLVDKVFNVEGALGGADFWDLDRTFALGPQAIKNRGRAVTTEDYEAIVLASFSQIARVRSLATRAVGPDGRLIFQPGAVTLIVVPKSSDPQPRPRGGLLRRVEGFLERRALQAIAAEIYAMPPVYSPIRIAASVRPVRPEEAGLVSRRVVQALEGFFHPLTGGEQGDGWPFGRSVFLSEVFAVIERVEGVDHVVAASFVDAPAASRVDVEENALVASGSHQIAIV